MINLTKKPFFLAQEDIEWVENTKNSMTVRGKNRTAICSYWYIQGIRIIWIMLCFRIILVE